MALVFQQYVKENQAAFVSKVIQISNALKINPNWLMIVMYSESGLNSRIVNSIGAVGLIQFLPATAYGLGTTPYALQQMSNVSQLNYVYKYFAPKAGKYKSVYDLYLYAFYPNAVGRPDSWIVGSDQGMNYARLVGQQNSGFDLDKNGYVTVGEFKSYIKQRYGKYISMSGSAFNWKPLIILLPVLYYYYTEEYGENFF